MLIGLTGRARSGKDTVAAWLSKNEGFHRVAFADPLKYMVQGLLECSGSTLEEIKDTELNILPGITPRIMLQTLGTEWGRNIIAEDIWLRFAEEKIGVLRSMDFNDIVLTDVRFDNEARFVYSLGGVVVGVNRDEVLDIPDHPSERGVNEDLILTTLDNNEDVEHLYEQIPPMLRKISLVV